MNLITKKLLGDKADTYWYYAGRTDLLKRLLSEINSRGDILDIGCGLGTELPLLSEYGTVTALDKNEESMSYVPDSYKKLLIPVEQLDEKEKYNLIVMLDVLEHIKHEEEALARVKAALKPDGVLLIIVPAYDFLFGPHDLNAGHYRRYSAKTLRTVISGFKEVQITYWNSLLSPPIICYKLLCRYLGDIDKPKSNIIPLPRFINEVLKYLLLQENRLRKYIQLPYGLAVVAIVKK